MRTILLVVVLALPGLASASIGKVGNGAAVTCGASATKASDTSVSQAAPRWASLCVPEGAANSVRVGGDGVTTATGTEVKPGKCYSPPEPLKKDVSLYCAASPSVAVTVQEFTTDAR